MTEALDWAAVRRVLAVRLDAIGDVLMTTPALRALKHAMGGRELVLLTSPAAAEVAALVPDVDDVIPYDAPWMKATAPRASSAPDVAMVDRLRAGAFDAAVIFTVFSQNPLPAALLAYFADIPRRVAHCHENPYQLLTDWVPDPEPARLIRHEVTRQLDLVAAIGCSTDDDRLSLCVPPPVRTRVRTLLRSVGVSGARGWFAVHPGASAPSRRYPPEQFADVARRLTDATGRCAVFTGQRSERPLIESIQDRMCARSVSLAGRLSIAEMAALLADAPLLISNNTGPVHVAAAVGTPVVDLDALTNPQHTPWRVPHRVLFRDVPCKYCYKSVCPEGHQACLRGVEAADVVTAALELLALARDADDRGSSP